MQKIYEILYKIKSGELNIAKVSIETGIPSAEMYKWKERGTEDVSLSDAIALYNWAKKDKSLNLVTNSDVLFEDHPLNLEAVSLGLEALSIAVKKIAEGLKEKENVKLDSANATVHKDIAASKRKLGKRKRE